MGILTARIGQSGSVRRSMMGERRPWKMREEGGGEQQGEARFFLGADFQGNYHLACYSMGAKRVYGPYSK